MYPCKLCGNLAESFFLDSFNGEEKLLVCKDINDVDLLVSIFIRTFKRAKGRYENEKLINPNAYIVRNEGQETIDVATELNGLLSDYFTEAAARLEPTIFINPEDDDNRPIMDNANALLIKYLMKHGSAEIRERIMKNSDLDELVSITTKHEDIDDATRKLIRVSRALRFI
jgi:hypothetical protein